MPKAPDHRVGYVLRRFPSISETFILNEVLEMEAQGREVEIYSILQPRDPKFHDGVTRLQASIRYIPNIFDLESLWRYNRKAQQRFGWKYWRLLGSCLATFRPMLVWRFPQGAYVAARARASACAQHDWSARAAQILSIGGAAPSTRSAAMAEP